jgi:6-phosphogluconolactonase (cycloisomerase 2 family)
MKFRKFGKTVLTAALSTAIVFSLSSCVRSFTVGYLYVTGTVTNTPTGNGIITGFKINNDTGRLAPIHGLPLGSGGANPARIVLLSGGNFIYVLNRGLTAGGSTTCTSTDPCLNSNITEFAVGGNGILTAQETFFTQGFNPFRLVSDTSGEFLFALDHDAPGTLNPSAPSNASNPNTYCGTVIQNATYCGDITVFQINSTTGRLTLVTNAQLTSQSSGAQVPYFPVQANPIDEVFAGSYLMTLAGTPSSSPTVTATVAQTVFPYSYNSSTGQLGIISNTPQNISSSLTTGTVTNNVPMGQGTAIDYAGGKVYILDNEPTVVGGTPGQILPFQVGTNGSLNTLTGGAVADDPTETSPIQVIVESKGKFLYVANQQGANSTDAAGIAGYVIDPSSSQLTQNPGSPYPIPNPGSTSPTGTGAEPVCMLEDPSNQYIYTANAGDSSVTGHLLEPNDGTLTQVRGWTGVAALTGPASWCVVTGRTN